MDPVFHARRPAAKRLVLATALTAQADAWDAEAAGLERDAARCRRPDASPLTCAQADIDEEVARVTRAHAAALRALLAKGE
jgi:hypothetical protein